MATPIKSYRTLDSVSHMTAWSPSQHGQTLPRTSLTHARPDSGMRRYDRKTIWRTCHAMKNTAPPTR